MDFSNAHNIATWFHFWTVGSGNFYRKIVTARDGSLDVREALSIEGPFLAQITLTRAGYFQNIIGQGGSCNHYPLKGFFIRGTKCLVII